MVHQVLLPSIWSVFPYICNTISFADPGGIILISPVRHSWLVTAVIVFEWEKQFKDVSTNYDRIWLVYHNYVRNPKKGGGFWREGVHLTLDRALQHLLVYSSTMQSKTKQLLPWTHLTCNVLCPMEEICGYHHCNLKK